MGDLEQRAWEEGIEASRAIVVRRQEEARVQAKAENDPVHKAIQHGVMAAMKDLAMELNALSSENRFERMDRNLGGRLLHSEGRRAATGSGI